MSKKIAAGAGAILLDVKTGSGAFMRSKDEAFRLSETMVRIGKEMGKLVVAVVTDMSQPLGFAVGNALEIKEAISVLRGEGPEDVEKLCIFLGGLILALVGKVRNPDDGQGELERLLKSGAALEKFKQMVVSQGGDLQYIDNPDLLPQASHIKKVYSSKSGYLKEIDALRIGSIAVHLGSGRSVKGEVIDPGVGVLLNHKVGAKVKEGELLATLYGKNEESIAASEKELDQTFIISDEAVEPIPMIHGVVPPFPT
jgi:thymidine phosphorylase